MKTKQTKKLPRKRVLFQRELNMTVVVLGILLLGTAMYVVILLGQRYQEIDERFSMVSLRPAVIEAATNLNSAAPVDAKTGDMYFPEAKLMLPRQNEPTPLTYRFVSADQSLYLSMNNLGVSDVYSANTSRQFFEAVPGFQACQRGLKITYDEGSKNHQQGAVLKASLVLNNNRTIFVYGETNCKDARMDATVLKAAKALRAY